MIPLIFELDEELKEGEEWIGTKTVPSVIDGKKHVHMGYVAIIKNFRSSTHLDIRYGSLRAIKGKEYKNNVL